MGTHRLVCPKCGENIVLSAQVTLNRKYGPWHFTIKREREQTWLEGEYIVKPEEDEFVSDCESAFICNCGFGYTIKGTGDSLTEEFLQKYPNAWKVVE